MLGGRAVTGGPSGLEGGGSLGSSDLSGSVFWYVAPVIFKRDPGPGDTENNSRNRTIPNSECPNPQG